MSKFHISNGRAMPCKAKGVCPLGGEHFDTSEEAESFAQELNEKEFGILGGERTKESRLEALLESSSSHVILEVLSRAMSEEDLMDRIQIIAEENGVESSIKLGPDAYYKLDRLTSEIGTKQTLEELTEITDDEEISEIFSGLEKKAARDKRNLDRLNTGPIYYE